jgi:hypothetical protein
VLNVLGSRSERLQGFDLRGANRPRSRPECGGREAMWVLANRLREALLQLKTELVLDVDISPTVSDAALDGAQGASLQVETRLTANSANRGRTISAVPAPKIPLDCGGATVQDRGGPCQPSLLLAKRRERPPLTSRTARIRRSDWPASQPISRRSAQGKPNTDRNSVDREPLIRNRVLSGFSAAFDESKCIGRSRALRPG